MKFYCNPPQQHRAPQDYITVGLDLCAHGYSESGLSYWDLSKKTTLAR
jgi:hypothetical protein